MLGSPFVAPAVSRRSESSRSRNAPGLLVSPEPLDVPGAALFPRGTMVEACPEEALGGMFVKRHQPAAVHTNRSPGPLHRMGLDLFTNVLPPSCGCCGWEVCGLRAVLEGGLVSWHRFFCVSHCSRAENPNLPKPALSLLFSPVGLRSLLSWVGSLHLGRCGPQGCDPWRNSSSQGNHSHSPSSQ